VCQCNGTIRLHEDMFHFSPSGNRYGRGWDAGKRPIRIEGRTVVNTVVRWDDRLQTGFVQDRASTSFLNNHQWAHKRAYSLVRKCKHARSSRIMAASQLPRVSHASRVGRSPSVSALSFKKHVAHRPPQSAPSTSETARRLCFSSNPLLNSPPLCAKGDLTERLVSKRRQMAKIARAAVNGTTLGPVQVQTVADHGGRNGANADFIQQAERPDSRSAQLPTYAEFVEPTSALRFPSRTTWSSVRLPTSFFDLSELAMASEGFWEAIASPQSAVHAAYFAARTAYFVGQASFKMIMLRR
jgi:hypothetical protein